MDRDAIRYPEIAAELVRRRDWDGAVRARLFEAGALHDGYHPEMEAVHLDNAGYLDGVVARIGYPSIGRVGREAAEAAWLIVQHAIGLPDFMRRMLALLRALPEGEADRKNLAYLEDRIAMYEGRPQLYGTQFDWDDDGRLSPAACDDPAAVDCRRAALGLPSLAETTERFRREQDFFPDADFLRRHRARYREWLRSTGWRP